MSLYPIPDVLVLGDSYDQYVVQEKEYLACNPGSFGADASFVVIRPSTLEIEESRIPDGTEEVEEMQEDDRAAPLAEIEAEEQVEKEQLEEDEREEEQEEEAERQEEDERDAVGQEDDQEVLEPTQKLADSGEELEDDEEEGDDNQGKEDEPTQMVLSD